MAIEFEISATIPCSRHTLFEAWLDSEEHSKMTGSPAEVSSRAGGTFEAWDGYIQGRNIELEPHRRIVQSWRTIEFGAHEQDSVLEVLFSDVDGGTEVKIKHSHLPEHGGQYKQGWVDNYFEPMKEYFAAREEK